MEASPPLSNAGPRKKTQSKVASEQALAWSGLPIVTIRPTVFLEGFFVPLTAPTVRDRGRIELPFGRGKTSPVASADVARVVAAVLADPGPHLGRIYELTGPRSQDMHGVARRRNASNFVSFLGSGQGFGKKVRVQRGGLPLAGDAIFPRMLLEQVQRHLA
jgi:hypothetical protein